MSGQKPTVLISGASTGIGEDAAKFLAEKGWTVFAGVRKEADAERLRNQHSNITPVILDVTKEEEVNGAVKIVQEAVGEAGLDVLINNAGLAYGAPIEFMPLEDLRSQFEVNVFGFIRLTQAALPLVRMGKLGRIINIGSIAADQYVPFLGAYDGSKAAMQTLSETLRRELKPFGIHVVFIKPGPVKTKFGDTGMANLERFSSKFPSGTEAHKYYGKDITHLDNAREAFMKHEVQPTVVTERIYEAMVAEHPKNIYYDTWGSYFQAQMYYWMPVSLTDRALSSLFFAKD